MKDTVWERYTRGLSNDITFDSPNPPHFQKQQNEENNPNIFEEFISLLILHDLDCFTSSIKFN